MEDAAQCFHLVLRSRAFVDGCTPILGPASWLAVGECQHGTSTLRWYSLAVNWDGKSRLSRSDPTPLHCAAGHGRSLHLDLQMSSKKAPVYFLSHGGPSLMFDDEVVLVSLCVAHSSDQHTGIWPRLASIFKRSINHQPW